MSDRIAEAKQYAELARSAAEEIAPEGAVGELANVQSQGDDLVLVRFATTQTAYRGWFWTVALGWADAEAAPTALETELLPGDDSLLAPTWVSWAERFAEYKAEHAQQPSDEAGATDADTDTDTDSDVTAAEAAATHPETADPETAAPEGAAAEDADSKESASVPEPAAVDSAETESAQSASAQSASAESESAETEPVQEETQTD